MTDEEKKEYEELKRLLYQGTLTQCGKRKLMGIIEKQSKEIEQIKYIKRNFDYCIAVEKKKLEDKIKAKIEKYDDKGMTINLTNRSAGKTFQQAVHYEVKKVLQSLLERD